MTDTIDWTTPAILHVRSDTGSEMYFDFETVDRGPLSTMVGKVAAMHAHDRARVILDVAGRGNLNVGEIMALAARPDFPAA